MNRQTALSIVAHRTHRIDLAMVILMIATAAILGTALGLVIYARI